MATATKAIKTFAGLRCPACGEAEVLSVNLETLAVECGSCDEVIDRADVEAMIATWTRLFAWIESAK